MYVLPWRKGYLVVRRETCAIVLPGKTVRGLLGRLVDCDVVSALGRGKIAEPGDVGHQVVVRVNLQLHRDAVQVGGREAANGVAASVVSQRDGCGLAVVILGQHGDLVLPGGDPLL